MFPEKASELKIEVDLVADMTVYNPFDFFIEEGAANWPFAYPDALARELCAIPSVTGDERACGDLVEACRLIGLAAAPFIPATAPRILAQLGHAYPYEADGNGGPALLDELRWGAHAGEPGTLTAPEPLFPRLETEARDEPAG